jgi:hypothetical protein
VYVQNPTAKAGQTVTYHVYVPSGAKLTSVQPFVLQGAAGGWKWTSTFKTLSQLNLGAWNTFTVTVPANAAALSSLGVEVTTSGSYTGTVYVDSVSY